MARSHEHDDRRKAELVDERPLICPNGCMALNPREDPGVVACPVCGYTRRVWAFGEPERAADGGEPRDGESIGEDGRVRPVPADVPAASELGEEWTAGMAAAERAEVNDAE